MLFIGSRFITLFHHTCNKGSETSTTIDTFEGCLSIHIFITRVKIIMESINYLRTQRNFNKSLFSTNFEDLFFLFFCCYKVFNLFIIFSAPLEDFFIICCCRGIIGGIKYFEYGIIDVIKVSIIINKGFTKAISSSKSDVVSLLFRIKEGRDFIVIIVIFIRSNDLEITISIKINSTIILSTYPRRSCIFFLFLFEVSD